MTRFFCFRTKGTKALWFALVSRSPVGLVMTLWALPRYFRWSVFVDLKLTEYIFSVTVAQNRIPKQVTWSSSSTVTSELLHFFFMQWIMFTFGREKKRTRFLGKKTGINKLQPYLVLICCWIGENFLECSKQWKLEQHGWCLQVNSNPVQHLNDGMVGRFFVFFVKF